ncbi:hypothetical protein [Treponema parvum]|uniref:hypothetical protein n=1 Tax=Treponema parvum TaxID=138851 RepID=UPI001AEBE16F|nr:hypothetical protein [Treponema parvum]
MKLSCDASVYDWIADCAGTFSAALLRRGLTRLKSIALYVLLVLVCAYGLYAFISRRVWRYLILQQQFFFLDMGKGYVLFFTDNLAIVVLFAASAHYGEKRLQGRKKDS